MTITNSHSAHEGESIDIKHGTTTVTLKNAQCSDALDYENLLFDFPSKRLEIAHFCNKRKAFVRKGESIGVKVVLKLAILVHL